MEDLVPFVILVVLAIGSLLRKIAMDRQAREQLPQKPRQARPEGKALDPEVVRRLLYGDDSGSTPEEEGRTESPAGAHPLGRPHPPRVAPTQPVQPAPQLQPARRAVAGKSSGHRPQAAPVARPARRPAEQRVQARVQQPAAPRSAAAPPRRTGHEKRAGRARRPGVAWLGNLDEARRGIVLAEILGRPVGFR